MILLGEIRVIVDTREKNETIYEFLLKQGVNVNRDNLDVGDILIVGARNFLIERKAGSDFVSSLVSGRLFEQLRNLVDEANIKNYEPILLLIGKQWKMWRYRKISPFQIAGVLNSIQFKYGVQVISAETENFAAIRVYNLVKMFDTDEKKEVVRPVRIISKKSFSDDDYVRAILEGFPGIGGGRAKAWYDEFGSLKNCLKAIDTGEITKIRGINDKILEALRRVYK